jgi:hypothetical protein
MNGDIKLFEQCLELSTYAIKTGASTIFSWSVSQKEYQFKSEWSQYPVYRYVVHEIYESYYKYDWIYFWYSNGILYGDKKSSEPSPLPQDHVTLNENRYIQLLRNKKIEDILHDTY